MRRQDRSELDGTWLCPSAADRHRLVDMEARLAGVRRRAMAVLGLALVASAPWVGLWTLLPLLGAIAGFALAQRQMRTSPRPEWGVAAAWVFAQLAIAASAALTGGLTSPASSWLAIPAVTLPARFTNRGVVAGAAFTGALILLVTVGTDPAAAAQSPPHVIGPLALLLAVVILSMALHDAERQHRAEAVLDPLTGMLNRAALKRRVAELTVQSRLNRQPVGVVALDIDHFKVVNDSHGHQFGDAVLKDVAYRLRRELRAYDLAYRLGGEEFVVLVPGATGSELHEVAERLRLAVSSEPVAQTTVTISAGIAHSTGEFDFDEVYSAADAALYEAKRQGRDRVCAHTDTTRQEPPSPSAVRERATAGSTAN